MRIPVPDVVPPAEQLGRVHFVGIGGAGLSAIARLMHQQGMSVTGSDAHDSAVVQALRSEGITVHIGHDPAHVDGADTVIATTAAREDNPEIVAAQHRGLRLWPRSAGLQSVLLDKHVVAIAGTHGKTTTTAMATVALQEAGFDLTFAIGAEVEALGTNARWGSGELAVVEADESDGAFLVYTPDVAVVTNVDADHLDHWGTPEAYEAAFAEFAGRARVAIAGDPALADVTAGFDDACDVRGHHLRVEGSRTTFGVTASGEELGEVVLNVPGRHYAQDALYALAVGLELHADPAALIRGLGRHRGAKRRMEFKGEAGGVRVYDTYAHHPSEIRGDLEAARAVAGDGRVVALFQPHLVSRTRIFGADMGRELAAADEVVVLDVYLAREDADPDVTGALVADAVPLPVDSVHFAKSAEEAVTEAVRRARRGDVVITLGAGDITELGTVLIERLEEVPS